MQNTTIRENEVSTISGVKDEIILSPHHRAWLSLHPNRTTIWLKEKLKEGFDIHHLDGNHENNTPQNLVMIEHMDHMMLHGGRTLGRMTSSIVRRQKREPRAKPTDDQVARAMRLLVGGAIASAVVKETGLSKSVVYRQQRVLRLIRSGAQR
ncbi:MAG: HNH endonuclease [Rhodopila sp.]|nr:HNH endonuclease [Rhodopila sp.]